MMMMMRGESSWWRGGRFSFEDGLEDVYDT